MILVAGGTGHVGSEVTRRLAAAGERVRVLSRHVPDPGSPRHVDGAEYSTADLATGIGLAKALEEVDAVIDVSQGSARVLKVGAARLCRLARQRGVRRAVVLSIINTDLSGMRYYRTKTAQESAYLSTEGYRVLRATQFHEFLDMIFRPAARIGLLPVAAGARFQPIDTKTVAAELITAVKTPGPPVRTVGGPEIRGMREFAEMWKQANHSRALLVPVRVPGSFGVFLRDGLNLTPENRAGGRTFEEWLTGRVAQP